MDKRFSIKNKLIVIFGLLLLIAGLGLTFTSIAITRAALTKRIEAQLSQQAKDTAEIIYGRIDSLFQFVEGIARMPVLRNPDASIQEKLTVLRKEVAFNDDLHDAGFINNNGTMFTTSGNTLSVAQEKWFADAAQGKRIITEPVESLTNKKWILTLAVPVYDDNRAVISVLSVAAPLEWLNRSIEDIVIGKTGYCYMIGATGNTIAFHDPKYIYERWNTIESAKTDPSLSALAVVEKKAITEEHAGYAEYEWLGASAVAGYARMPKTGWGIIIRAPLKEFMNAVTILKRTLYLLGFIGSGIILVIVFLVAYAIVKPINRAVCTKKYCTRRRRFDGSASYQRKR